MVASTLNPLVGVTLHGYISGATVFADANGNGQLDPGEVSTTTDANGNFILFGGTGPLVAFGGTDTSTGLPFKGVLEAPAGSSVIDPLTTMLSGIVSNTGLSEAAAQQKLLSGLGLPSNINLTTFDPIATAKGGDAAGAGAYVALAKVYDTVDIIATALSGVGVNFSKAYADTFAALDNAITALPAGQTLDLADQATIASLISSVSHTENVNLTSAATVASAIVASNIGLDQALARDGASPTLLADVANDQKMVLAPQPTVVPFAPTVVEKSQTTVIATVAPGAPGDTLTLTETAGVGTLSLGPLQSDGTEQVIYTAPASISQSAVDAVTYTVNESDGAHATVSANVQLNAGPTIIAATVSGTEGVAISGATVATFTDANPNATASDFTATIDWGDGTSTTGTVVARSGGGFAVDGTHTYADEGKYNIGVSIKDEGGSTASATSTATVADADLLTSHGIRLRGHVGQTLTNVVVATFKDAYTGNIASDFTATINWGDGVKTAGVVTDLAGNITVSGTHTFETSGRDTVTVTLRDDSPDSATATATSKVAIPSVKLRIKPGDGDNIINYAEAHSIHGVLITGREKGLVAGESFNVTVTDKNFSKTYTAVVGEKGSWTATIPIVDALKLADGTATITAQVGNVMAFGKVTVAETLPTVTINKVNGSDVIVNQAANCGGAGNHEDGGRDQLSVGWQQWADDNGHKHDHEQDRDAVTLSGMVSGIAPHSTLRVTVHDGTFSKNFTAIVNATGNNWVATIPGRDVSELPTGMATVTAQVTDRYGNTSLPAVQHVTVKACSDNSDLGPNHCDTHFDPSTALPSDPKGSNATLAPPNLFGLAGKGFGAGSTLGYAMSDDHTISLLGSSSDANIALLRQSMASSFVTPSEGHSGTLISESPHTAHPWLSLPHG